MIYIFDKFDQVIGALSNDSTDSCPFWRDQQTEILENGYEAFEFYCPLSHPTGYPDLLINENKVGFLEDDDELKLFRIKIAEEDSGSQTRYIKAEHDSIELINNFVRPGSVSGSPRSVLEHILFDTRWKSGNIDSSSTEGMVFDNYATVIEALLEFAKKFDLEIRFRTDFNGRTVTGRYVDLVERVGGFYGKRFEYAKDVKGLRRTVNTADIATALIGVGKSSAPGEQLTFKDEVWSKAGGNPTDKPLGQDWVGDEDAVQNFGVDGRHIFRVYESDASSPQQLIYETWEELQRRIKGAITYEVAVVLLDKVADSERVKIRIGDTVTVQDTSFARPLTLEARVVEITRSKTDPTIDNCVLGEFRELTPSASELVRNIQTRISQKSGVWDAKLDRAEVEGGEVSLPASALQGSIDTTQNSLKAVGSYDTAQVIADQGYLLENNNIASPDYGALYFGPGLFAIANTKDTNGNWAWSTFGTPKGFSADWINAGTMLFDLLKGGTAVFGGLNDGDGKLLVQNENGEAIFELNSADIGSSQMYIGKVVSPSVLSVLQESMTIYVNRSTGDDLNDGKSSTTPFKTIQAALNSIPKYLKGSVTVDVATATYNEEVLVNGFTGEGNLIINLNKCGINGRLLLQNCSNIVRVAGQDFNNHAKIGTVNSNNPISVVTCQYVTLDSLWGKANNRANHALYVAASNVYTYHCVHERATRSGMFTTVGGNIYAYGARGSGNTYGAEATSGSKIHMEYRRPGFSTASYTVGSGGTVSESPGIATVLSPGDTGTSNPEPITVQQGTLLKTSSSCLSWDDRYGWKSGNNLYQGDYGYGNHRGLMYFPSMTTELSGKTIKSVRLYMTRLNEGGSASSSKLYFYLHNYSSQSTGMPQLGVSLGALGSYAWDEQKWINLPLSVGEAIRDGTAKGLAIYSSSGNPYVKMNPAVQIEISYEG
jgi:phage minor structural protein